MPIDNLMSKKLLQMLEDKKHVIWDWNGTLLNDVDHAVETMNHLLFDHDLPSLDKERYQKIFDFPVQRYYDSLGFDYAKESFESLCHRFVDRFMAGFHRLPLVEGMESVLLELKARGVQQSILSATIQSDLDQMISHYKLEEIFKLVYGIDNKMAGSKIERGRELVVHSGVDCEDTVIVGDTLHDLEVARHLGISAVLVGHGHQDVDRLKQHHPIVL